jgi:hypothetical protein
MRLGCAYATQTKGYSRQDASPEHKKADRRCNDDRPDRTTLRATGVCKDYSAHRAIFRPISHNGTSSAEPMAKE